jgi:hypothetical protein
VPVVRHSDTVTIDPAGCLLLVGYVGMGACATTGHGDVRVFERAGAHEVGLGQPLNRSIRAALIAETIHYEQCRLSKDIETRRLC